MSLSARSSVTKVPGQQRESKDKSSPSSLWHSIVSTALVPTIETSNEGNERKEESMECALRVGTRRC